MPTHVLSPTELSKKVRGEVAGERTITRFHLFYFGAPKIDGELLPLIFVLQVCAYLILALSDSNIAAFPYDRRLPHFHTIKVVFQWLPNCEPDNTRPVGLEELPDSSEKLVIPPIYKSAVKAPPSISAQLRAAPVNETQMQDALKTAVPHKSSFRFDEPNERESVTFVFNYRPQSKYRMLLHDSGTN